MQDIKNKLFYDARSAGGWIEKDIDEATIKELYNLTVMGPTSFNCLPLRIVFIKSNEAKEKLKPAMMETNIPKTMSAPYVAILATDYNFPDEFVNTFPGRDVKSFFVGNQKLIDDTAFRNATLEAGYFIMAARLLGLDVAPMSGFNNQKVDELFFANTTVKSNFICALGYADKTKEYPRLPRPKFDAYAKIV